MLGDPGRTPERGFTRDQESQMETVVIACGETLEYDALLAVYYVVQFNDGW